MRYVRSLENCYHDYLSWQLKRPVISSNSFLTNTIFQTSSTAKLKTVWTTVSFSALIISKRLCYISQLKWCLKYQLIKICILECVYFMHWLRLKFSFIPNAWIFCENRRLTASQETDVIWSSGKNDCKFFKCCGEIIARKILTGIKKGE